MVCTQAGDGGAGGSGGVGGVSVKCKQAPVGRKELVSKKRLNSSV